MTEAQEQTCLFQWAGYQQVEFEELKLLHHVPNGGKRDKRTAIGLKRQGVKAGVPDVVLPCGRGGYFGLYIELKVGKNKTSDNQKQWIKDLKEQNYLVEVCYGWREVAEVLLNYIKQPKTVVKGMVKDEI
ncbi:VRR-NUC domain-containing protein [Clostridium botulinum]|uniref:VRR-NUC domain-containing protein n=1 Tax=unclassified Clostridium TaxID=2614128 RepID=UPI0013C6EB43|nr:MULTISPECIES: VRR-NUC domain-containing protein [unclassified Clostridium]MBY7008484.1 VRR-NUC domain-containing protein [Clostridium botulinum]NFH73120.1 VRR-NUC domain-containing protein [Clostridium botulinum]NFI81897.1 VRR-NUC domain-containing protein [Clostridium botulinum]NFJ72300.1 VRR-NUC domain-containing protein [Clostridium botulinum]NFK65407.1 VRR-NUC domain-containing protein [Clostridium botulinum]